MEIIALISLGAASGLIAGLAGLGGGTVIVPALTWIFGKAALNDAIVVSWFCVLCNSIGATASQLFARTADERAAYVDASKHFLLGVVVATPVAALMMSTMRGLVSPAFVGGLQLTLAIALLWPKVESLQPRAKNPLMDAGVGAVVGGASALIGIGGGAYTTAYVVYGQRRPLRDAIAAGNMTGLAVGVLSVSGFCASLWLGHDRSAGSTSAAVLGPPAMALLVVSGAIFSAIGVELARKLSTRVLRSLLVIFLALSALHLVL